MAQRWQKGFDHTQTSEAFVYVWYDSHNRRYYLGYHKGSVQDRYTHSSTRMIAFTVDHIPAGFRRRIIHCGTAKECIDLETKLLRSRLPTDQYYNVHKKVPPRLGKKSTPQHRARQRLSWKKRKNNFCENRQYALSEQQVAYIRSKPCHYSVQKQLAQELGVTWTMIYQCQKGTSYNWLPMPNDVPQMRYRKTKPIAKKLTEQQARRIRCADRTPHTRKRLSARFGVNLHTIRKIQMGKSWSHLV